jgi:uncharacterized membrane protein
VKPHLLALFALWLLWEAYRNAAGRKVVLAGVVVGVCACVPPTLANPHVWNDYIRAVTAPSSAEHHHLSDWAPPLAGWWLRQAVPGQPFWVQWVPLFLAVAGSVCCWRTIQSHRKSQADALPWLVGCSLLVAPYGVWQHDLVLLLVPVLAVAARLAERFDTAAVRVGLTWLASVNAVSLAMMLEQAGSRWYVWFTPCVLLGCAVVSRLAVRQPAIARVEAGATA